MNEIVRNEDEQFPTGAQLDAYLTTQLASSGQDLDTTSFVTGRLVARRIGEDGVDPLGLVWANALVTHDCIQGTNGFSGDPMPDVRTTVLPETIVRGAFGDEFADQVMEIYRSIGITPSA